MASKRVGQLIKEARTAAGLTQAKLANKVSGVTASDIGRVERGEINLTNEQLKKIAKALGITQTSLLNAPKNSEATATGSSSSSSSSGGTLKLTATEKKLVKAYRAASSDVKKSAMELLTGKAPDVAGSLGDVLQDVLGGLLK